MVCISKLQAKLDDNPSAYIQTIQWSGISLGEVNEETE